MTDQEFKDGLEEIESQITENKEMAELGKALRKLQSSKEWKKVIEEKYFEDEAKRIPEAILNPNNTFKRESLDNLKDGLMAIRNFKLYIQYIEVDSLAAEENIEDLKQYKKDWAQRRADEDKLAIEEADIETVEVIEE